MEFPSSPPQHVPTAGINITSDPYCGRVERTVKIELHAMTFMMKMRRNSHEYFHSKSPQEIHSLTPLSSWIRGKYRARVFSVCVCLAV